MERGVIKFLSRNLFLGLLLLNISAHAEAPDSANAKFDAAMKQKRLQVKMSSSNLKGDHTASTLLISCVDFRLRDETESLMQDVLGLKDDYDEISIPGASLALANNKYPHWTQTLEEIIAILQDLHHIKRVIFLDHRNCGAYTLMLGKEHAETKDLEFAAHKDSLMKAKKVIQDKFPNLSVHSLLIGFDGGVDVIGSEDSN
jgi:hypothetical protein